MVNKELIGHLKRGLEGRYRLKDMVVNFNGNKTYQLKISSSNTDFAYLTFVYIYNELTLKLRFSHFIDKNSPFKFDVSYDVDRLFRDFFD